MPQGVHALIGSQALSCRREARVLVVLPTFNELASLPRVLNSVFASVPDAEVLVVDDNSPDGTGEWTQERAVNEPRLHVLHRASKLGLGSAYKAGFAWGMARGFDILVEMDADGSHAPSALPALLHAIDQGADLAIGSRYVPGGGTQHWPLPRQLLSRTSNAIARRMLGLCVRDATAGFRAYRADLLAAIDVGSVASDGYAFQVEMLWRAARVGARIVETPIMFVERAAGSSKMCRREILDAAVTLVRLRRAAKRLPATARLPRPAEVQA